MEDGKVFELIELIEFSFKVFELIEFSLKVFELIEFSFVDLLF